jgi:hypothetical protein
MKVTLTLIILLILLCACGGGGGKSLTNPTLGVERPITLEAAFAAAVGDYTWWENDGSGPYVGRIELQSATCIRLVIEIPDKPRSIDVLFDASEAELSTGVYVWKAHSGEIPVPRGGYYYRLDLMISVCTDSTRGRLEFLLQELHIGHDGHSQAFALIGIRQ